MSPTFAEVIGKSLYSQLLSDGKKTGEIGGVGSTDGQSPYARFDRLGATNITLLGELRNGDFEKQYRVGGIFGAIAGPRDITSKLGEAIAEGLMEGAPGGP